MLKLLERIAHSLASAAGYLVSTVWDVEFALETLKLLIKVAVLGFIAYQLYEVLWMHHELPAYLQTPFDWLYQKYHSI